MSEINEEYKRPDFFSFLKGLIRAVKVILWGYLFYKLIISQTDIFLDIQSFLVAWATFYVSVVVVNICGGFIIEERNLRSYLKEVFFRWPINFIMLGPFIFYLIPYTLPLLQ